VTSRSNENVRRLDVAVHNTARMRRLEPVSNINEDGYQCIEPKFVSKPVKFSTLVPIFVSVAANRKASEKLMLCRPSLLPRAVLCCHDRREMFLANMGACETAESTDYWSLVETARRLRGNSLSCVPKFKM
jgi:hypothetical protein